MKTLTIYTKDSKDYLYDNDYIKTEVQIKILPGKFDFHEAIQIKELIGKDYKIPNLLEAALILKELNKKNTILGSFITSDFKEFGEDGNWIYVANYNTFDFYGLSRETTITINKSIPTVRNARYSVMLIKIMATEKVTLKLTT